MGFPTTFEIRCSPRRGVGADSSLWLRRVRSCCRFDRGRSSSKTRVDIGSAFPVASDAASASVRFPLDFEMAGVPFDEMPPGSAVRCPGRGGAGGPGKGPLANDRVSRRCRFSIPLLVAASGTTRGARRLRLGLVLIYDSLQTSNARGRSPIYTSKKRHRPRILIRVCGSVLLVSTHSTRRWPISPVGQSGESPRALGPRRGLVTAHDGTELAERLYDAVTLTMRRHHSALSSGNYRQYDVATRSRARRETLPHLRAFSTRGLGRAPAGSGSPPILI